MDWYYAQGGQQRGPVTADDLGRLSNAGVVTPDSLVWHSGMPDWQPYGRATGASTPVQYAGFWIRFVAYMLDGILIEAIQKVALAPFRLHFVEGPFNTWSLKDLGEQQFGALAIALCYFAFFWTRYGATPGKMVLGLKIVSPHGLPITPGQAVGRYFGTILSGLILGVGFFMAGWDDEKRALHDRLADTRVIRERR